MMVKFFTIIFKIRYNSEQMVQCYWRDGSMLVKGDNFLELANKIYTPSYISFEIVLVKEGIIFQKYQTIFAASYLSRRIKVGEQEIFYRKIKNEILLNNLESKRKIPILSDELSERWKEY